MMGAPTISSRFDDLGCDGAPVRLGIMGGTFDPIHFGHLSCAEQARELAALDAVVFIPTGNPNFKQDQQIADATARLEMCRIACLPNPHFDVSDIEIARGGVTYTVDTLEQLREHFPSNVELLLIMGADSLLTLSRWRGSERIAQLAHILAVTRPGVVAVEEEAARLREEGGFTVDVVEASTPDISSSDLRQRICEERSLRYFVPAAVRDFLCESGLYRQAPNATDESADEQEALSDEFLRARAAEVEQRVSAKRAHHIAGVAEAAGMLARTYGVDERKARLAGLLHDWDKGLDDEGIRKRVVELGLTDEIDPWVVEHMPTVLHGPTAACALGREFPCIPPDVLQAIERHTTAAVVMSDLDKVLYVADAIEESRQYGRIDELRALVGNASLDELYQSTYEYWTLLLIERKKPLHPATIAVWNACTVPKRTQKGE